MVRVHADMVELAVLLRPDQIEALRDEARGVSVMQGEAVSVSDVIRAAVDVALGDRLPEFREVRYGRPPGKPGIFDGVTAVGDPPPAGRRRGRKPAPEDVEALRRGGQSYREIARRLGCSVTAAWKAVR